MISNLFRAFKEIIHAFIQEEKVITQIRCLVNVKRQPIYKAVNQFKLKYRNFAILRVYNLARKGYKLNTILMELKNLKEIMR